MSVKWQKKIIHGTKDGLQVLTTEAGFVSKKDILPFLMHMKQIWMPRQRLSCYSGWKFYDTPTAYS